MPRQANRPGDQERTLYRSAGYHSPSLWAARGIQRPGPIEAPRIGRGVAPPPSVVKAPGPPTAHSSPACRPGSLTRLPALLRRARKPARVFPCSTPIFGFPTQVPERRAG